MNKHSPHTHWRFFGAVMPRLREPAHETTSTPSSPGGRESAQAVFWYDLVFLAKAHLRTRVPAHPANARGGGRYAPTLPPQNCTPFCLQVLQGGHLRLKHERRGGVTGFLCHPRAHEGRDGRRDQEGVSGHVQGHRGKNIIVDEIEVLVV
jgi:hypothetical protein